MLALGASAAGCRSRAAPSAAVDTAPPATAIEVEYAGCKRVLAGPVCELEPGALLTLWVPVPFRGLQVTLDGRPLAAEDRSVAGGYQASVAVAAGTEELSVAEAGRVRFRLRLTRAEPNALLDRASAAKNSGDFAHALELVAALEQQGSPVERLLAQGIEARVALRQGELDRAVVLLLHTAGALFEQGRVSEASDDVFALLFTRLHRQFQFEDASRVLERWRQQISQYPLGRALIIDHEAMLAAAVGDTGRALYSYGLAQRAYERLGQLEDYRRVQEEHSNILGEMGQLDEALVSHSRLLPPDVELDSCAKAHIYTVQAWLTMLKVEQGEQALAASVPALLEQSEAWERRCGEPEQRTTGMVNRGLWALATNDLRRAQSLGAELRGLPMPQDPYLGAWVSELQGRLALAGKRYAAALGHFRREQLVGRSAGHFDPQIRALVGLADVEGARAQPASAEGHLHAAVSVLERAQDLAPLGALAHTQFAARQAAARRLVRSSLAQGQAERAYRVALASYRGALALQARAGSLRGLSPEAAEEWRRLVGEYRARRERLDAEIAADWQLSDERLRAKESNRRLELGALEVLLDRATKLLPEPARWRELPSPESDEEFWLFPFPVESAWVVFGVSASRVAAVTLEAGRSVEGEASVLAFGGAEQATHPMLVPFAEALAKSKRLVILAAGAARDWPFERWRFDGVPLALRGLSFGAGLPRDRSTPGQGAPPVTAVVADPGIDLPFAQAEGLLVQQALKVPAERSLFGEQATASNVLRLFESVSYLHFAGHAQSDSASSAAALRLAHGTELRAWELFGLKSVPRQVVLSACQAGRAGTKSIGAGWGLAQALLALGAESVLAPLQDPSDSESYQVQQLLYRELASGASFREAFWATEQKLTEDGGAGSGLRLFVR